MKLIRPLLSLLFISITITSFAQTSASLSIPVVVSTNSSPAEITFDWPSDGSATEYRIYRVEKGGTSWGTPIAILSGTDTTYTDTVTIGKNYEYRIWKNSTVDANVYFNAGIDVGPEQLENKGIMILLVEKMISDSLPTEISTLTNDLKADGWQVRQLTYADTHQDWAIKDDIKALYNTDNVNALFIIGNIKVPYSGNFNPDAHPDHKGAWPADVYYGELTSIWYDMTVNNSSASRTENKNIPGDGKWDAITIPSDVELQIGRVDFANLSTFSESEVQLMRNYLNKLHDYKVKTYESVPRGLIDDNFGYFSGEAFGQNGWRNFTSLLGFDSIDSKLYDGADYFTDLATKPYLWAYGCGGGSYTSCSGVGNTGNFAATDVQTVFTFLFGSYFGDWDANNNFLRAGLASGKTLTCAWAGRPNWFVHHMGLGENIGYSARLTQNNKSGKYAPGGYAFGGVHVALMGDPSLRQHVLEQPSALMVTTSTDGATANLSWTAPSETVDGYNVYRAVHPDSAYEKINTSLITSTSWSDMETLPSQTNYYMVRAQKTIDVIAGSYANLSLGIFGETVITSSIEQAVLDFHWEVVPNPTNGDLRIVANTDRDDLSIRVLSVDGRTLRHIEMDGNYKYLDISEFSGGLYVIQLLSKGGILDQRKVIKR